MITRGLQKRTTDRSVDTVLRDIEYSGAPCEVS